MDPYEAYKLMHEAPADSVEKGEAAYGLADWLDRGGFWDTEAAGGVTRQQARREAERIGQAALMELE